MTGIVQLINLVVHQQWLCGNFDNVRFFNIINIIIIIIIINILINWILRVVLVSLTRFHSFIVVKS